MKKKIWNFLDRNDYILLLVWCYLGYSYASCLTWVTGICVYIFATFLLTHRRNRIINPIKHDLERKFLVKCVKIKEKFTKFRAKCKISSDSITKTATTTRSSCRKRCVADYCSNKNLFFVLSCGYWYPDGQDVVLRRNQLGYNYRWVPFTSTKAFPLYFDFHLIEDQLAMIELVMTLSERIHRNNGLWRVHID